MYNRIMRRNNKMKISKDPDTVLFQIQAEAGDPRTGPGDGKNWIHLNDPYFNQRSCWEEYKKTWMRK